MGTHPSRKHVVRRRHIMWFVLDVMKISASLIMLALSAWLVWWTVGTIGGLW